jgi:hypothetical protein
VEQASRSSSGFWLFLYMRSQWEKLKIGVKWSALCLFLMITLLGVHRIVWKVRWNDPGESWLRWVIEKYEVVKMSGSGFHRKLEPVEYADWESSLKDDSTFLSFSLWYWSTRVWTQGLVQVLYLLSQAPAQLKRFRSAQMKAFNQQ